MKIKSIVLLFFSLLAAMTVFAKEVSVPKDSDMVVYIDVTAIEQSPLKPILEAAKKMAIKVNMRGKSINEDFLNGAKNVLFSSKFEKHSAAVLINGDFDVPEVEKIFEEQRSINISEIKEGKIYYNKNLAGIVQKSAITVSANTDLLQNVIAGKDLKTIDLKTLSKATANNVLLMAYLEMPEVTTDEDTLQMNPIRGIKNAGLSLSEDYPNVTIKVSIETVNETVATQVKMQIEGAMAMLPILAQKKPEAAKALQSLQPLNIIAEGNQITATLTQDSTEIAAEIPKWIK